MLLMDGEKGEKLVYNSNFAHNTDTCWSSGRRPLNCTGICTQISEPRALPGTGGAREIIETHTTTNTEGAKVSHDTSTSL